MRFTSSAPTRRLVHILLWLSLLVCASPAMATAQEVDVKEAREAVASLDLDRSPSFGKADAMITLIVFSDYQCPFCKKSEAKLVELEKKYGEDVRIVRKHFPLPFHKQAKQAARAAHAAHMQGKFELMHNKLFDRQKALSRVDDVDAYMVELARFIGLDEAQFKKDYAAKSTLEQVEADIALAKKLGLQGTPSFFINGIKVVGNQPTSKFETVIDDELATVESSGKVAGKDIHAERFELNYFDALAKDLAKKKETTRTKIQYVPVEKSDPVLGNRDRALVTLVIFSDFECPYCQKGSVTMQSLRKHYGKKELRIVFKHLPLPFHKQAEPAARAAVAAHKQGEFWAMHDLLFYDQEALKTGGSEYFIGLANKLDLNVKQFEKDFDAKSTARKVDTDKALAEEVGARGTPNFFINGIQIAGAQPEATFKATIDAQLELARSMQKKDKKLRGEKLYKALVDHNKTQVKADAPKLDKNALSDEQLELLRTTPGTSVLGDRDKAKVVIYEFTDLQCPFCKRADATMLELKDKYGDDLAIVTFHFPLVFHKQAERAARAVVAADKQGKGHAMRELIFAGQDLLKKTSDLDGLFVDYASELGLDVKKFRKDYAAKSTAKKVKEDMALGSDLGVRGTPNFFVEHERLVGAQPYKKFEDAIEAAMNEK